MDAEVRAQLVEVAAEADLAHIERQIWQEADWRYIECSCGRVFQAAGLVVVFDAWRAHRAEAVIDALSEALVPPKEPR